MTMRRLGQRTIWSHGSRFVVRSVGAAHGIQTFTASQPVLKTTAPAGMILFGPDGRFIARLNPRDVGRWVRHFALKRLLE